MSSKPPFDLFVEKVVLHNRLVPGDGLAKAKSYLGQNGNLSLLEILVRAEMLNEKHARLIQSRYDGVSASAPPSGVREPDPGPASAAVSPQSSQPAV